MEERRQGRGTDYSLHPGTCGLNVDRPTLSTTRKPRSTGNGFEELPASTGSEGLPRFAHRRTSFMKRRATRLNATKTRSNCASRAPGRLDHNVGLTASLQASTLR